MKYLLDTNICIYLINKKPAHVVDKFKRLRVGDIGISAITYSELAFGVAHSIQTERNSIALQEFAAPLEVLDYPTEAASAYGRIRSALKKQGRLLGPLDMLIAAHALHLDVTLVTNNLSEFARIPDLRVENWASLRRPDRDQPHESV